MRTADRFDLNLHVEPNTGCLLWVGATVSDGYGNLWTSAGNVGAHRFAWERDRGPIPPGACVLHSCDTPACCNVDHLFLGDHSVNAYDREAKGRGWQSRRRAAAIPVHVNEQTPRTRVRCDLACGWTGQRRLPAACPMCPGQAVAIGGKPGRKPGKARSTARVRAYVRLRPEDRDYLARLGDVGTEAAKRIEAAIEAERAAE